MSPWHETTLGEFVSLQRGHDLPANSRGKGRVPVVGSFGITGYHNTARAKGPGVTVGRSGASAGTVFFVNEDYWPHNTCLFVTDFQGNNPRFAYYLLSTLDLPSHAGGSAQASLNRNHIAPLSIRVPERAEQNRIVEVLSALDDKIELNRRMNETLEQMAQAIFKDWFVDFGPVRRKQKGASDPIAIMGGIVQNAARAAELATLFPDALGDDGLPEGWIETTVGSVSSEIRRGLSPVYAQQDGVLVLNQKCVRDRRINFGLGRRHNTLAKPIKGRTLQLYDVLINSTGVGTLGRAAQVWFLVESEVIVDSHVTVARPDRAIVSPAFFGVSLVRREADFDALGEGSTGQTELARGRIASMDFLCPPKAIQNAFDEVATPLMERVVAGLAENRLLAETRDYLLPKLMSGEVRVRDAEKHAESLLDA